MKKTLLWGRYGYFLELHIYPFEIKRKIEMHSFT